MKKRGAKRRANALDVTIGGEGVSPETVPVRALAELLQAAASALEAVARSQGAEPPEMHLVGIKNGSAAYVLASESENAGPVIVGLYEVAKSRGKGATPEVRHALRRLHGEATKIGALRMRANPLHAGRARKEITIAAPVDERGHGQEAYVDVYGRVVGIYAPRDGALRISLRLEEGHTEDFAADEALISLATSLFSSYVRARVVYVEDLEDGKDREPLTIEAIAPWDRSGGDIVDAVLGLGSQLADEGVEIDSSKWLREMRGDD